MFKDEKGLIFRVNLRVNIFLSLVLQIKEILPRGHLKIIITFYNLFFYFFTILTDCAAFLNKASAAPILKLKHF